MTQGRDRLAARRRAQGHTQESLAEILDVAVSTVARWEQGRGGPLPALRRPLADALSVSLHGLDRLLGSDNGLEKEGTTAPDGQSPVVPSSFAADIDRRTFLFALGGLVWMPYGAGSALPAFSSSVDPEWGDEDLVRFLWRVFEEYSVADWTLGPRHLLPAASGTLGVLDGSLRSSPGGLSRAGLLEVGARWAELVSWLQQDAGGDVEAGWWADRAMDWAQEAGDGLMVSYVLVRKSALAAMDGDGARTVGLAQAAQREPRLPSRVRAVALQQDAYGHALMGDGLVCHERLDQAGKLAERGCGDGDDPRDPARYCVPEYVEIQRATCWWALAEPRRAIDGFEQGLAGLPAVHRRDRGVYLARLALARADAGDPEPAATAAGEALRIAHGTGSGRILGELERLRPRLDRWSDRPAIAEVRAMLPGSA